MSTWEKYEFCYCQMSVISQWYIALFEFHCFLNYLLFNCPICYWEWNIKLPNYRWSIYFFYLVRFDGLLLGIWMFIIVILYRISERKGEREINIKDKKALLLAASCIAPIEYQAWNWACSLIWNWTMSSWFISRCSTI